MKTKPLIFFLALTLILTVTSVKGETLEDMVKDKNVLRSLKKIQKEIARSRMLNYSDEASPGWLAYIRGDSKKAFEILKPLAEKGNYRAQYYFGRMYEIGGFKNVEGGSVKDRHEEAIKWYQLAAKQGDADAQYELGSIFYHGRSNQEKNIRLAVFYYKQAAQNTATVGYLAQSILGKMYSKGEGVIQDYVQAHMWFNVSHANGHKKANELRDDIAKKMTPSQIAEAQKMARNWEPKNP